jgi:hypothetical protein
MLVVNLFAAHVTETAQRGQSRHPPPPRAAADGRDPPVIPLLRRREAPPGAPQGSKEPVGVVCSRS